MKSCYKHRFKNITPSRLSSLGNCFALVQWARFWPSVYNNIIYYNNDQYVHYQNRSNDRKPE